MIELYAVVTGKVQGVSYRAFLQESATTLGVTGYTKNAPDGSVLVLAQGLPDTLKEFVEYMYEGSSLSSVDSVGVDWRSVGVTFRDFSVLE